jgi:rhamnogalacturonan hydrolase
MNPVSGDGVQLSNITVRNWKGTEEDGAERGPIKVVCAAKAPCTDITIEDFAMWTESGDSQSYNCENGFGTGFCLQEGDGTSTYSTAIAETAAPTGYEASSMANDLSTAFGTDASIPIPTIPTSFFPGATPYSALAGAASGAAASATPSASVSATASRHRHRRGSH